MDLDRLSRNWQQQHVAAPNAALPTAAAGSALSFPVAQMQRNAWVELIGAVLFGVPIVLWVFSLDWRYAAWAGGLLAGLQAITLLYHYRQLALLRGMRQPLGSLRQILPPHIAQLRQLLRLNYQLSLWLTAMIAVVVLAGMVHYVLPVLPAETHVQFWTWLVSTIVVGLTLVHLCLRWHFKHSYGKHLARLESTLHDLGNEA
ncbi:hypothetical protein [Solirubrum puertoriconensis]|uniref:Uncharacterized protein n=1 Tax=Solirubrum puertoriconensis TaxID=1751427 RepID=A0A9X0L596_SOLP1|nr:hypothetical protein [Solirubrum puertoriconensis]KUG08524.1 hypothetical protein ASU33_10200 [Solirubrum puertoriconensis]